ncbi:hypothetical protein CN984_12665 [Bacillus cereus]|uniref:Uncharacterized protein n=1 Tax=Bacillus cereus TaxID=1396 RepID=A0A2B9PR33_BACCE|nr:hypothetical protein [Bacillus cereus]PGO29270.1 hypothetical protein CN984_12665 [Bacillus cereus]
MKVITWDVDDIQGTMNMLDMMPAVDDLVRSIENETIDTDAVRTDVAIAIVKRNLMGEYHGLLVKQEEERLVDSEIYILTFDGEASEGGDMYRLTIESIVDILVRKEATE